MSKPAHSFNKKEHKYFIGRACVPSVTQVIGPLNSFDNIPSAVLKNKADWGNKIDKMCELHLAECLDERSIDDAQKRVLDQFDKFLNKEGRGFDFKQRVTKYRGYHDKLLYAGESDIIIPHEAVFDIKTRPPNALTDPLQLAGYEPLWTQRVKCNSIELEHHVLSLFEDRYIFQQYNKRLSQKRQSWTRFRSLLDYAWATIEFNNNVKIWKGTK